MSPEEIEMVGAAVAGLLAVVLPLWKFYSARKALVDMGLKALSFAATEVSKRTDNKVDDKFALFFRHLSGSLEAEGKKVVSEAKARKVFDALQGKGAK